jgi:hypothetical protein
MAIGKKTISIITGAPIISEHTIVSSMYNEPGAWKE